MKERYSGRLVMLAFLCGAIFIAILYIIFPSQIPHKIYCESEEHQQLLEQLSGVNQKLDEAYLCDKYFNSKKQNARTE